MGKKTEITWCDHTFNPWWGCLRVSPGCEHCYAETQTKRWGHQLWGPEQTTPRRFFGDKHWNEPLHWNAAAPDLDHRPRVFCASMADVFEDRRDLDEPRARLWRLIEATPNLDWLLLTKRPENMRTLVPESWRGGWPPNIWAGTTTENQEYANLRLRHLAQLRALVSVLFVSAEPLLGPVSLDLVGAADVGHGFQMGVNYLDQEYCHIDWVITGGESGPRGRWIVRRHCPHGCVAASGIPYDGDTCNGTGWVPTEEGLAWVRSLRDQCRAHGVAFFHKQWGGPTHASGGRLLDGRIWADFPRVAVAA